MTAAATRSVSSAPFAWSRVAAAGATLAHRRDRGCKQKATNTKDGLSFWSACASFQSLRAGSERYAPGGATLSRWAISPPTDSQICRSGGFNPSSRIG